MLQRYTDTLPVIRTSIDSKTAISMAGVIGYGDFNK
jgi:hypothetical protein